MKTVKIGNNRGNARVWLQGIISNDFYPTWSEATRYNIQFNNSSVLLQPHAAGKRKLAAPKKGGVIDLNSKGFTDWLAQQYPDAQQATIECGDCGTITITPVS